ncbi:MAG: putative iron-regulated protein [Rhodospirillales bacterium]|nr:putative iron-regulated protein [Rhodospirillales bacterium]
MFAAEPVTAKQLGPAAVAPVARPQTYRIAGADRRLSNYDAKAEIQGYAQLVADSYAAALTDGQTLKAAIAALLANPNDDTLTRARDAWINGRRTWELTEAFRFYDGPIDVTDTEMGPISRLDGWPIDTAAIDYVEDNPTSGIINNMKLALTRATLLSQGQSSHVTITGWHAIEFLLWGQEPSSLGEPGDRPVTDYLPNQPNNDRRRTYLKLTADMLVDDLHYLVESWDPKSRNSYAAAFRLLNQREALGRIMNGIAQLTGQELAINRLAAALDANDGRKLTSRFSATSYQDFVFGLRGVRNVWTGDQGGETRPGLSLLVGRVDPALAQRILHALDHAEESVGLLRTPLERETLPAPANSPSRQKAERAIADLKSFAALIRDAGAKIGVAVYLPN